jgi:hypothetical protein
MRAMSASPSLVNGFLYGLGVPFLAVFALPLLFAPLTWARWFRWRIPTDTDLCEYFGRCLGAVAIALIYAILRVTRPVAALAVVFEMAILAAALLCAVHILGAVRRRQPWTETAEIALYALAGGFATWVYVTAVRN